VYGSTLPVLSAKFEYMIQNILKIKEEKHGSNLVYSNYLSMEGLGIFTMILDIMGWKKIIIEESGTDLAAFEFKWNKSKVKIPTAWKNNYADATFEVICEEDYLDFVLGKY
jgi:hypothetical protein